MFCSKKTLRARGVEMTMMLGLILFSKRGI